MRQTGLGKGLGALLPSSATPTADLGTAASSAGRLLEIPIAEIRPNSFQPRSNFDEEDIESLTASIRELGVLQPILVRPAPEGGYELIAGERRWRSARRAGLNTIPAVVKTIDDTSSLEQALVENLQRADLNPIDEATAYKQLLDEFGLSQEQVAQRVGKSRAAVANTLRLTNLSPSIQRLIIESKITAGHARALLGTSDKSFQEALARRIVTEELTVRKVEEAVRMRENPSAVSSPAATSPASTGPSPKMQRPAGLLELEDVLASVYDTRVAIEMVPNKKGRMLIEFADLNDLERIFRIMTIGNDPSSA